jgi:hypothetical protein
VTRCHSVRGGRGGGDTRRSWGFIRDDGVDGATDGVEWRRLKVSDVLAVEESLPVNLKNGGGGLVTNLRSM